MKVWVLTKNTFCCGEMGEVVIGVFSTEEKVLQYIENHYGDYDYNEFEIN